MTEQQEQDEVLYARDEISFDQLGNLLEEMAEELQSIAQRAKDADVERLHRELDLMDYPEVEIYEEINRRVGATTVRTLGGLKRFRRNYEYYERAIAEWALSNDQLSQRDVARYLGIGLSTVNRWAQNPLKAQDNRE